MLAWRLCQASKPGVLTELELDPASQKGKNGKERGGESGRLGRKHVDGEKGEKGSRR